VALGGVRRFLDKNRSAAWPKPERVAQSPAPADLVTSTRQ
jgi:hypothetical protein